MTTATQGHDGKGGIHYIRRYYGVPAKIGGRVKYEGREGVITGTSGPHLIMRPDDRKRKGERLILHPTWRVEYLTGKVTG